MAPLNCIDGAGTNQGETPALIREVVDFLTTDCSQPYICTICYMSRSKSLPTYGAPYSSLLTAVAGVLGHIWARSTSRELRTSCLLVDNNLGYRTSRADLTED